MADIYINGTLQKAPVTLGQQLDANVKVLRFMLPTDAEAGIELSALSLSMKFSLPDESPWLTTTLTYVANGGKPYVEWELERGVLQYKGYGFVQVLAGNGDATIVWNSERVKTYVHESINAVNPLPAIAPDWASMLAANTNAETASARGGYETLNGRMNAMDDTNTAQDARADSMESLYGINAKQRGVVGDGVVDDTAAIQDIIDSLANIGGKIILPAGQIKITAPLVLPTPTVYNIIEIAGESIDATRLCYYGSDACIKAVGVNTNRIHFKLRDMEIRYYGTDPAVNGVTMQYNGPYTAISDVAINFFNNGIASSNNWNIYFTRLHIKNCTNDGVNLSGTTNAHVFFGGEITNSARYNLRLTGFNHTVCGTDFSSGTVANLYLANASGIDITGYMEMLTDGTAAVGIKIDTGCSAINIHGINVSTFGNNVTLIDALSTKGLTINGFYGDTSDNTVHAGTIGINLNGCESVSLCGVNLNHLAKALRLNNITGQIISPVIANCTVPFEVIDNLLFRARVRINSSYVAGSTIPANAFKIGNWELENTSKSGPTSDRPVVNFIGQQFYDTTLNKAVWWNGTAWKDAAGTTV